MRIDLPIKKAPLFDVPVTLWTGFQVLTEQLTQVIFGWPQGLVLQAIQKLADSPTIHRKMSEFERASVTESVERPPQRPPAEGTRDAIGGPLFLWQVDS